MNARADEYLSRIYWTLQLKRLSGEPIDPAMEAPLPHLLAAKFNYDVTQGGFSQLFFNLQGQYLSETEDMLIAAEAHVAHTFFVRAVEVCLANREEYQRFLASDYLSNNDVKDKLHGVTIEYFNSGTDFSDEIAAFVECGS
jgi:hypothetical protein